MSDWTDIGPGACEGEKLRQREVKGGVVIATVYQNKRYDARGDLVVGAEETRALTFVPASAPAPQVLTEG